MDQAQDTSDKDDLGSDEDEIFPNDISDTQLDSNEKVFTRNSQNPDESEDYDVTLANAYQPSAIGLSFLVDFHREIEEFRVELMNIGRLGTDEFYKGPSAIYRKVSVKVGEKKTQRSLWFRTPLQDLDGKFPNAVFRKDDLNGDRVIVRKQPLPNVQVLKLWLSHVRGLEMEQIHTSIC